MTGDDLIHVAGHLVANTALGNAEARYRSAVSRAYYGAYHKAVELLESCGVRVPENAEAHQFAYARLFATGIPAAIEAARSLNDLRGDRNDADYHLEKPGFDNLRNAQDRVELAHSIRNCLADCIANGRPAFEASLRQ
jgi:uncharacterized protein (UPF0332 family)